MDEKRPKYMDTRDLEGLTFKELVWVSLLKVSCFLNLIFQQSDVSTIGGQRGILYYLQYISGNRLCNVYASSNSQIIVWKKECILDN